MIKCLVFTEIFKSIHRSQHYLLFLFVRLDCLLHHSSAVITVRHYFHTFCCENAIHKCANKNIHIFQSICVSGNKPNQKSIFFMRSKAHEKWPSDEATAWPLLRSATQPFDKYELSIILTFFVCHYVSIHLSQTDPR